jgi:hypothetical protein
MNRSYSKIRHIKNVNIILESRKVIREFEDEDFLRKADENWKKLDGVNELTKLVKERLSDLFLIKISEMTEYQKKYYLEIFGDEGYMLYFKNKKDFNDFKKPIIVDDINSQKKSRESGIFIGDSDYIYQIFEDAKGMGIIDKEDGLSYLKNHGKLYHYHSMLREIIGDIIYKLYNRKGEPRYGFS